MGAARVAYRAPVAAAVVAALATAALVVSWASGAETLVDLPWIPRLGSRLTLKLDALAAPLAIFTSGLAIPILVYTRGYMPRHLREHPAGGRPLLRFCLLMLAFMSAMVLLVAAQDLLLIYVALEVTAVISFLLIAFDQDSPAARKAAIWAVVITAGSALLFLLGVVLVFARMGTTALEPLRELVPQRDPGALPAALLAAGVLAKSAQVPLHVWLPRAMVAPTPVSAYLHSATLVAAGVLVLQRLRFLIAPSTEVLEALYWIGLASILVGSLLALVQDELKRILAYSTIAQYGYVVVMLAIGGAAGVIGAPTFVIGHGLAKCSLFMVAGAVTHATGATHLSGVGGLARRAPLLALAAGVAAAGLAGLPLTIGYFKDEPLFAAAGERGLGAAIVAVLMVALTFAYAARFWLGIFGRGKAKPTSYERPPVTMTAPIVAFAVLVLAGGLWPGPLKEAMQGAGAAIAGRPVHFSLAYHLNVEAAMALCAWGVGTALVLSRARWEPRLSRAAGRLGGVAGPDVWLGRLARGVALVSQLLLRIEARDLRERIAAVLVPIAVLVGIGFWASDAYDELRFGAVGAQDVPLVLALLVVAGAALIAVRPVAHLSFVLLLSFVGFGLSLAFAFSGAPDVALVVVIVEILLSLLFLLVLSRLDRAVLERAMLASRRARWSKAMATLAGLGISFLTWGILSTQSGETVAFGLVDRAKEAHADDVVTAVLADFRGLDTGVELTVLAVAVFGAASIWRIGR